MPHECGSLNAAAYGQSRAGCGLPDAPDYRTTRSTEPKGSSRGNAKHTWIPPTKRRQDALGHKTQTNGAASQASPSRVVSAKLLLSMGFYHQLPPAAYTVEPKKHINSSALLGQEVDDSGGEILQSPPLWADLVAPISEPDAAGGLGCLPALNVGSGRGRRGRLWLEVYFFHNLE